MSLANTDMDAPETAPTVLSGQTTPAQAAQQPQAAPQQPQQPSMFRQILAGALIGMAHGAGAKDPGQAVTMGANAVDAARQQTIENQQRQQQLDMEQKKTDAQVTELNASAELAKANAGKALVERLISERNLSHADAEYRVRMANAQAQYLKLMNDVGMVPLAEIDDTHEAVAAYMQHMMQTGQSIDSVLPVMSPNTNKVILFKPDPGKMFTADQVQSISKAFGIEFPKIAMPVASFDLLLQKKLADETSRYVADQRLKGDQMRAGATLGAARINANSRIQAAQIGANSKLDSQDSKQANSAVQKFVNSARDLETMKLQADDVMGQIKKQGYVTGPQSMMMLSLHIASTFGNVKGVRMGQDMIEHHLKARDLPQNLEVMAQKVRRGGVISVEQANEFYRLIQDRRRIGWKTAQDEYNRWSAQGHKPTPVDLPSDLRGVKFGADNGNPWRGASQRTQPSTSNQ
jgi:hypothetical protein